MRKTLTEVELLAMKKYPKWYGTPTVAEYLGIHPEKVREKIRNGEIKAERLGRLYRIHSTEIYRLLKEKDEATF